MKRVKNYFIACLCLCAVIVSTVFFLGCSNKAKSKIEIYTSPRTVYYIGEVVDLTDAKIVINKDNGEKEYVAVTDSMISSFTTASEGTRQAIIKYQDYSGLFTYTVKKPFDITTVGVYYARITEGSESYYGYVKFNSDYSIVMVKDNSFLSLQEASTKCKNAQKGDLDAMFSLAPSIDEVVRVNDNFEKHYSYDGGSLVCVTSENTFELSNPSVSNQKIKFSKLS